MILHFVKLNASWQLVNYRYRKHFNFADVINIFVTCRSAIKEWIRNLVDTLLRRYRWGFVIAGFVALAMAAISWKLENTQTYWIWHRYDGSLQCLFASPSFPP